jgi:hypothetical protein
MEQSKITPGLFALLAIGWTGQPMRVGFEGDKAAAIERAKRAGCVFAVCEVGGGIVWVAESLDDRERAAIAKTGGAA